LKSFRDALKIISAFTYKLRKRTFSLPKNYY
jgi:hypothetical protein